jgi:hypothetical protein
LPIFSMRMNVANGLPKSHGFQSNMSIKRSQHFCRQYQSCVFLIDTIWGCLNQTKQLRGRLLFSYRVT